jgi:copper transport protein
MRQRAMMRRGAVAALAVLVPAVLFAGAGAATAAAHTGLLRSEPAAGAALGAAPGSVRLIFSERPDASLSAIRVLDARGAVQAGGAPVASGDDGLLVGLAPLRRGVYVVRWRGVSAVDGHATSGSFRFGVGERPTGAIATSTTPGGSPLELLGRWLLIAGLAALLGAATAGLARFGGTGGAELRVGAAGWVLAVAGLALLFDAQRRAAGAPVRELLASPVGEALGRRAAAIAAAGAALLVVRGARRRAAAAPGRARAGFAVLALAAAAAMAAHAAAGHAAAGGWPRAIGIGAQWAHFAAAGIWAGGLATMLLGLRGAPSEAKAAAVRRFGLVAAAALVVVALAGTVRAIDELAAFSDLWSTGYGRAVLAKVALLAAIVAVASAGRRRARAAAADLAALRRTSRGELASAAAALAVAAVLGTIAPPVAGGTLPPGLSVSGADARSTLRVQLTAASAAPGANTFTARVTDDGSGEPVRNARVRLRFEPLDDPGIDPTSLALAERGDGDYAGTGANLAFDGRWRVSVLVARTGATVAVPLELDVPGPEHFVSVGRGPGNAPTYTAQILGVGYVRIVPEPERPGPSVVAIDVFTVFEDFAGIERIVVTHAAGTRRAVRRPVRRRGPRGRFLARVTLVRGANTITVTARDREGTRVRAAIKLQVHQ